MNAELLAPAGSEQSARAALCAGANAVYLGLKNFSARDAAENFDLPALRRISRLAHLLRAKVYVALNTLVKDGETDAFFDCARAVWNAGADAILVQDLFLGRELKRRFPEMTLHLSTQAGCCNRYGAEVARDYGFSRVVLARETPYAEIADIASVIETEVFVQGALCTCFSGQCYLSSFAGGNSGNRGRCKQPCRKLYSIDRAGFETPAYALSTSDLSLGGRLRELLAAGVCSLKIEGRMRRPEYVAAAVKYYRALLGGEPSEEAFRALKRAYNRGDYTEGLGFGQTPDFLSRNVQGHIGEKIGTVTFVRGKPFCRTRAAAKGDGFKILRGGLEAGGAAFAEAGDGGFYLSAGFRLCEGDEVRLTTSVSSNAQALSPVAAREAEISLRFTAGKPACAVCGAFVFEGDVPLEAARSAPLSEEDLADCFLKTGDLPLKPRLRIETDGVFMARSALNAFRRDFYEALADFLDPERPPLPAVAASPAAIRPEKGTLTAVIGETGTADVLIYKPRDYARLERPAAKGEVYLYLPPFFTKRDEALIAGALPLFDGIFCEGYYGIALAKTYDLALFAGFGWNLTNAYAVAGAQETAKYFALSKELSVPEQNALAAKGAFTLAGGAIKVMDLCYCPFGKTCRACDRRGEYRLTDGEGRSFPLVRYRFSQEGCRFELYNCASLAPCAGLASALCDRTVRGEGIAPTTKGHAERSMI